MVGFLISGEDRCLWWRSWSMVRERAEGQVLWEGGGQGNVWEEFGRMWWTVVKAIAGGS